MRIIGVLDLLGGRAVHARRGDRARYAPVGGPAGAFPAGGAVALARWYRDVHGVRELYVADLDALAGRAPQRTLLRELAAVGVPLLVDAAVVSTADAQATLADGAARVVVALESLPSFGALHAVVCATGAARTCFGLDLRAGEPIVRDGVAHAGSVLDVAGRAVDAGVRTIVAVDVARVGSGAGVDVDLLVAIRARCPDVELLVGGGVRDAQDLARLAAAGVDGALVATALLEGRVTAADVEGVEPAERLL